jgi:hypothetical protein
MNGFDLFTSKKDITVPYKSWKKILKLGAKGMKEAEFCADFKELLR